MRLQDILDEVKIAIWKTNPDYDIVIKRLHLCYEMKLVTFGIDKDKNLIIQFPVFIQPYTQTTTYTESIRNSTSSNYRPEHTGRF